MRTWLSKYREEQVAPATWASFVQLRKVWAADQTFWGLCQAADPETSSMTRLQRIQVKLRPGSGRKRDLF